MESHNFFSKVYTDKETERLSEEYDVMSCPESYIQGSFGMVEPEIGAYKLLSISKCFGEFVGISQRELDEINSENLDDFVYIGYLDEKYIRTKKKGKLELLFPTEELLINQKIRRKE